MDKRLWQLIAVLIVLSQSGCAVLAQGSDTAIKVVYYSPAWGPDEKGEEVVYFLKQVTLETAATENSRIYFCSIKPDGTKRREIARLWADKPEQFLEPYSTASTMEVNGATKRAAIGVEKGEISGVFVVDLDGKNFRGLWPKEWNTDRPAKAGYPTWSPDGQWIAFHEYRFEKGFNYYRLVKCRPDATDYRPLTERDAVNCQPAWSPSADLIAYVSDRIVNPERNIHSVNLWLMKPDGTEKRDTKVWGNHPRWSPDGKVILHDTYKVVDPISGQLLQRYPYLKGRQGIQMWPKWGKSGFLFVDNHKIGLTNLNGDKTIPLLRNAARNGPRSDFEEEAKRW